MATLLTAATGNFTSAGTWALCDSTSELDSNSSQVSLGTGNTDSGTFTPGAITVDGVAVKLYSRAASPSGTITITLRNSTDATNVASVTINVSDLPANADTGNFPNGWIFFKFGSSQLLVAAKAYLIRATTSASSQVSLWGSSSTNMSRQLRTTTTQAPASGDKLIAAGEWTAAATSNAFTITMDNTASTTFGNVSFNESLSVCQLATFVWGTSASTNYLLKIAGYVLVTTGGVYNQGTSGTPVPSTSTAILDFVVSSNVDSGLRINGGTVTVFGASKTTVTTVTSTANSGQAVVNVASVTGWANNDEIILTPTERNSSQYELRVIQSIASLAVTVTSNFSNKHSGSSSASVPNTVRGHVGMLTHTCKIRGTSNSLRAFIYASTNASLTMQYCEMKWLGNVFTTNKQGLVWATGTTIDIQYTSFNSGSFIGNNATGYTTAWTYSNNVCYAGDGGMVRIADTNNSVAWVMSGNLLVNSAGNWGFQIAHMNGATFTNNISAGHAIGCYIAFGSFLGANRAITSSTTWSGNDFYNNSQSGYQIDTSAPYMVIANDLLWRNGGDGVLFNTGNNAFVVLDGLKLFGNANYGLRVQSTTPGMVVRGAIVNGETSFSTTSSIHAGVNVNLSEIQFENCEFSQIVATGTEFDFNNVPLLRWTVINCKMGAATPVRAFQGSANFNIPFPTSIVRFQRFNQTAGDHRTYQVYCNTKTDTVIYHTASPSERITPRETNAVLKSTSSSKVRVVASGNALTASVWVRKSQSGDPSGANYNGNQPRLIMRRNPAVGLNSDVVLDTMTVAVGNWEQLSGTTSATSGDDGALEFYVDCDGNAGWINVDDWSIS